MNLLLLTVPLWFLLWFAPVCGLSYLIYYFVSLPMRRDERARLFLDVVETGFRQGQSLERTVASAAELDDSELGGRFRRIAQDLKGGSTLRFALDQMPHYLPPPVQAMLQIGADNACLPCILPACRRQLRDGTAGVWRAQHSLAVFVMFAMPVWVGVFTSLMIFVVPKFRMIMAEFGAGSWPLFNFMTSHSGLIITLQLALFFAFALGSLLYVGGPGLTGWLNSITGGLADRLQLAVPWRRERILRNFSGTLAVLLDAGIPEARALTLAAGSTGNQSFAQRAGAAVAQLEQGNRLAEATEQLDPTGEFRWRLTNASQGGGNFSAALAGWHEALDVRAFQQEQVVAQLVTTSLVLVNGLMVGLIVIGVFQGLLSILNAGLLW